MIGAALDAGARCAFVLADALYGAASRIRRMLEARQQPYVLATRSNHTLRLLTNEGLEQTDPLTLADALPPEAWAPQPKKLKTPEEFVIMKTHAAIGADTLRSIDAAHQESGV